MRILELVKVRLKETGELFNYSTLETVRALLQEIETKKNLPIFDILRILMNRKVNSLSFTRDDPYFYFYSRLDDDGALIRFNELEREVEISLTIEALRNVILLGGV